MTSATFFVDLNHRVLERRDTPRFTQNFVIVERSWLISASNPWIDGVSVNGDIAAMLDLGRYDEVVITNAADLETLGWFSGAYDSKSDARRNNLKGGIPHGLHLFGPMTRTFWVWNPGPPTGVIEHSKRVLRDAHWEEYLVTMRRRGAT